jgi:hypothetical protein
MLENFFGWVGSLAAIALGFSTQIEKLFNKFSGKAEAQPTTKTDVAANSNPQTDEPPKTSLMEGFNNIITQSMGWGVVANSDTPSNNANLPRNSTENDVGRC